jgi:hypothetical protein
MGVIERIPQITVYGGTGKEEKRQKWVDEFGNSWAGTGNEAKSYYKGYHQAAKIVFEKKHPRWTL